MGERLEESPAVSQPSDRVWALLLRLIEEAFVTARWLMASLLTINSGSAFAIVSATSVPTAAKLIGGCWFGAGIVGAIFLGMFQMNGARAGATALVEGSANIRRGVMPWLVSAWIAGLMSLIFFLVGAYQVGVHLK